MLKVNLKEIKMVRVINIGMVNERKELTISLRERITPARGIKNQRARVMV